MLSLPAVGKVRLGSVTQLPVRGRRSSWKALLHRHRPAAVHRLQLLRQRLQRDGREQLRRRQRSPERHHRGSALS